ncbi:MAG: hypothetical protein K5987_05875 [Lachnospiraceae bacterium]|nr:hypothetical protein [Lachnospiraceae bacterium]
MKELWGIMNILDGLDDVAVFVVSSRDKTLLYCNHLVSIRCNAHTGVPIGNVWDESDYMKAVSHVREGGVYRYQVENSVFGSRRNVTVSRVVWSGGMLAYSFVLTAHVDDREEREREKIFNMLGRAYQDIYLMDMMNGEVSILLRPEEVDNTYRAVYYYPVSFDEWRGDLLDNRAHPEDREEILRYLEPSRILKESERGDFIFQYRKKCDEKYVWTEMRFSKTGSAGGRLVCCERPAGNENSSNKKEKVYEAVMRSLNNAYRSVYLIDLQSGLFDTVKRDELLFGIPEKGSLDELLAFAGELIDNENGKKDLADYFSSEALKEAFEAGAENVGREYISTVNSDRGWMGVNAMKPPYMEGMENKCILSFMDVTEHKRVEAERTERNVIIDVLSVNYIALYYLDFDSRDFHSVRVPPEYKYIEKQFPNVRDALLHYTKAYVLEQYRDVFNFLFDGDLREHTGQYSKHEYVYRTVGNRWMCLEIFPVMVAGGSAKAAVISFRDYGDHIERQELSMIYNATLLADYDVMYEYNADTGRFYTLAFDGTSIIREENWEGNDIRQYPEAATIHPDDMNMYVLALSESTVEDSFREGKTVSHMFIRDSRGTGQYRLFMYAFHYFEEMGKRRVLITARDADREFL